MAGRKPTKSALPVYYVRWRGRISGPFPVAELRGKLGTGELSLYHDVSEDQSTWFSLGTLLESGAGGAGAGNPRGRGNPLGASVSRPEAGTPTGRVGSASAAPPRLRVAGPAAVRGAAPSEAGGPGSGPVDAVSGTARISVPPPGEVVMGFLVDSSLCLAAAALLALLTLLLSPHRWGTLGILQWLSLLAGVLYLWWLYFAFAQASSLRGTPGQRLYGIHVAGADGQPPDLRESTTRFFLGLAATLCLAGPVYWLSAGRRRETLHDHVLGSRLTR